jgi:hypothetical protein
MVAKPIRCGVCAYLLTYAGVCAECKRKERAEAAAKDETLKEVKANRKLASDENKRKRQLDESEFALDGVDDIKQENDDRLARIKARRLGLPIPKTAEQIRAEIEAEVKAKARAALDVFEKEIRDEFEEINVENEVALRAAVEKAREAEKIANEVTARAKKQMEVSVNPEVAISDAVEEARLKELMATESAARAEENLKKAVEQGDLLMSELRQKFERAIDENASLKLALDMAEKASLGTKSKKGKKTTTENLAALAITN